MEMENMSNRSSVDKIDRISELPESVLLHIMSLLDMKEVVKTSVLSKNWEYIWTYVPTLTFEYYPERKLFHGTSEDLKELLRPFVMWINKILFQCQNLNNKIRKFHVGFWYMNEFAGDVDLWAKFVARNKIQDMTLDFSGFYCYKLPRALCQNSSLLNLSISKCIMAHGVDICWTSLRSLSIADMKLDDYIMTKILSGSPMLQVLKISNCQSLNVLHIYSNSLEEVIIDTFLSNPIEISAPNIQSFHILGELYLGTFRLCSSSLFKAELDFRFNYYYDSEKEQFWSSFMTFIESILPVVQLEVGFYFLEALSLLGNNKSLSSLFSRLTFLNFTGIMDKRVIVGIICLLKCSPNLEKLVLTKTDKFFYHSQEQNKCLKKLADEYWETKKGMKKFELPYLKMIKFNGFKKNDEFTRVLLKILREYGVLHDNIVIHLEDLPTSFSCLYF